MERVPTATLVFPTATPSETPSKTPLPTVTSNAQPPPCAETAGQVRHGTLVSAIAGGEHAYSAYLPPCFASSGERFPVLYLLAGNIHNEDKWLELGLAEAADAAITSNLFPPFLIVMPDGGWVANNTSGGPGSYESLILDELIPHIERTYCAWVAPQGRAIGGLSRGGYWALEIAFRFPERFVSVGGHSAALLDTYAGPTLNPQFTALSNELGDLRIYLDIGSEDYLRTNTIRLHEDMSHAGVPHEWHLNEGKHEDAYWAAHVAEYLLWYGKPWTDDQLARPACDP